MGERGPKSMKGERKRTFRSVVFWLPLVGLCLVLAVVLVPLFGAGYVRAMLNGPDVVLSVPSPDGSYTAYVENLPSLDPPNQSMSVERGDQRHFMWIGNLAGDVDAIEEILWSPDGEIVVFQSRHYLTATRVSDWRTIRVYLGREWTRTKAARRSTFTSGGVARVVEGIEFPERGVVVYRLRDEEAPERIQFDVASE